jgi:hypothetical protein
MFHDKMLQPGDFLALLGQGYAEIVECVVVVGLPPLHIHAHRIQAAIHIVLLPMQTSWFTHTCFLCLACQRYLPVCRIVKWYVKAQAAEQGLGESIKVCIRRSLTACPWEEQKVGERFKHMQALPFLGGGSSPTVSALFIAVQCLCLRLKWHLALGFRACTLLDSLNTCC